MTLNYFFDESLNQCEDWDWFMRANELGTSIQLREEITYSYRQHAQNMTDGV